MSEAKADRDARRAAALRENLRRRKAAARARAEQQDGGETAPQPGVSAPPPAPESDPET